MLPVLKSTVVGKNTQFIPNLNPSTPSLSPGAQPVKIASPNSPHFVIQAQRSNTSTPIHPNTLHVPVTMTTSNKPTIAYLGQLFKQSKTPDQQQQQLVVPANPINANLVPNPKLLLTSMPVLPKLAPAPTSIPSSISSSKMTSVLVPVSLPTQSKPATINLKIANSPIQATIETAKTSISG